MYFLVKAELAASLNYFPRYRFGPVASIGTVLDLADRLSVKVGADYHQPVLGFTDGYYQGSIESRFSTSTNTDLRLQYDVFKAANQGGVTFNVYY